MSDTQIAYLDDELRRARGRIISLETALIDLIAWADYNYGERLIIKEDLGGNDDAWDRAREVIEEQD